MQPPRCPYRALKVFVFLVILLNQGTSISSFSIFSKNKLSFDSRLSVLKTRFNVFGASHGFGNVFKKNHDWEVRDNFICFFLVQMDVHFFWDISCPLRSSHGLLFPQQNYIVMNAPAMRGVSFNWWPFFSAHVNIWRYLGTFSLSLLSWIWGTLQYGC